MRTARNQPAVDVMIDSVGIRISVRGISPAMMLRRVSNDTPRKIGPMTNPMNRSMPVHSAPVITCTKLRNQRLGLRIAATITAFGVIAPAPVARAAHKPFAWAPAGAEVVERGRLSATRFGLLSLHEVTVEVDDAFAAANREALAVAEQRIAEVPGVRAVIGPAGLLDITVDARGHTTARTVLARGRGKMVTGAGEPSESEGEAARQRVVRRSDALGWFLTENGRRVRFFVDADSWPRVAPGVATALAASGLGLAPTSSAELEAHPQIGRAHV